MKKEIKIEIPQGYEIDEKNSTFEKIVFKKKENNYPLSALDLQLIKEGFFIDESSTIKRVSINGRKSGKFDLNILSSRKRAEAFLALMQLIELRDAWNAIDQAVIDFKDSRSLKYCLSVSSSIIQKECFFNKNHILAFSKKETRDLFAETFKDLIETAKELL